MPSVSDIVCTNSVFSSANMDQQTTRVALLQCPMCSTSHLPVKGQLKNGIYACTCEKCSYFFKFRSVENLKDSITLTINGTSYQVGNEHNPATSLLEFMRKVGISRGTKGFCFEGGCGVCLVTVKLIDPLTSNPRSYTINSCCLQLYTCDGLEITTIEGLGSTKAGLHPVQDRLAKFDGAQCGFCTPGQIMTMYGLLQNNPKPTMQVVEDNYDATLCRCTGYRSILDAMKSFASDAPASLRKNGGVIDIEELEGRLCKKTGQACVGHCSGQSSPTGQCHNSVPRPLHIVNDTAQWFKPTSLAELYPLLKQYSAQNYRLVFGNTGFGVYGEVGPWNYSLLIDIRGVKELYSINLAPSTYITVGANVSLTTLKEIFDKTTDPALPYAQTFVKHLGLTASSSLRNLSSWAGNLALKNLHKEFPSDVYTLFETVGAQISIADGDGVSKQYSLTEFLSVNLKGKVITSIQLPKLTGAGAGAVIRTFKTSHRLQLCHAHVTSGFNFQVDATNNYLVLSKPAIVVQGINGQLVHAIQTETFLVNKKLGDTAVLQSALTLLTGELVPESGPLLASTAYRKSLAIGHFYKFVLGLCQNRCISRYASGGLDLVRPIMTASHDYGTDNPSVYPATKPMMKLTAYNLTTGEVRFVADQHPRQGQLYAAPVLSTQGNAKIQSIDPTLALQIPGVVAFIKASDIPGVNDWRGHGLFPASNKQELLCSSQVLYAGQPIGILVAEDEVTAQSSRYGVQVTYTDIQPALTDVDEAIQKKSFFNKVGPRIRGNPTGAMAAAPHKVSGMVHCTDQYNFHLENQAALSVPTDTGGMDVMATTQWQDTCIEAISQVLGIPENSIAVETQRLGGGFGGKAVYNAPVAAMSALAAQITRRPVLLNYDIHTNMQSQGKRVYYVFEYQVGFDNDGKILAIIATCYSDVGAMYFSDAEEGTAGYIDNVYNCPNWSYTVQPVKTNKPLSTSVRAPGSAPAIFGMECIIDHVGTYLQKDQLAVRKLNFMKNGDVTLAGVVLDNCLISDVVTQLETDIKIATRVQAVADFNKNNRWKKKGFHVMPNRYGMGWNHRFHPTSIFVNHGDATVHVCHGGIDMGQGINTKVIQCCAYKLGIPVDMIKVKATSTTVNTNSLFTAGSTTSEMVCLAAMKCCDDLLQRLAPSRAKLPNPTWKDVIRQAYNDLVDLRAHYMEQVQDRYPAARYSCWSAAATEVELDVLTGQYQVNQVDILNDIGISLNPELDIGQLEGGFIMGCGLFLLEGMKFDPVTGQAINDGTWEYKPPMGKDLPVVFNVKFLRNAPNPNGVLGSKAIGENPVSLGASVLFALKRAVEAARAELGHSEWFPFHAPASVERIQLACLNDTTQFTFGN